MFDGESSLSYGLMLYDIDGNGQDDIAFGNKASIVETRTYGRVQPLHFGVNYHSSPLKFPIVFGADHPLDRHEMELIALWLTGRQKYTWLSICQPDLAHVQFRCLITELKPISVGWLPYAMEANVVCDCPYAYGHYFEREYQISGETSVLFRNEGSVREYFKPEIEYHTEDGVTSVSIVNRDDGGREFRIEGLPSSAVLYVDNTNGIIRCDGVAGSVNVYDGFNLNFLRFVHGDNHLIINGDGRLIIRGRFLHNVAG